MTQGYSNNPLYSCWPFWILELDANADSRAVEKAYANILGAINLQIPAAEKYLSPLGLQTRDEFQLRDAKAILLDPERRGLAEFWYLSPDVIVEQNTRTTANTTEKLNWKELLGTI